MYSTVDSWAVMIGAVNSAQQPSFFVREAQLPTVGVNLKQENIFTYRRAQAIIGWVWLPRHNTLPLEREVERRAYKV